MGCWNPNRLHSSKTKRPLDVCHSRRTMYFVRGEVFRSFKTFAKAAHRRDRPGLEPTATPPQRTSSGGGGRGFVDPALLKSVPRRRRSDELAAMIRGMRLMQPGISLRAIADQLQKMGVKSPRGHTTWSRNSVAKMLEKTAPTSK